jgi:Raf kinase inhibitor-like YbhB/YbcL family protein
MLTLRSSLFFTLLSACASSSGTAPDAGESVPERDAATTAADTATTAADAATARDSEPAARDATAEVALDATAALEVGDALLPDTASASDAQAALRLTSSGFLMRGGELIFPASASYPMDQSPPFAWSGAPSATRSFALTFVDKSNGATKWVIWDIPPDATMLPANLSKTVHPTELPASSQRGSLGRTGYSGPGVPGPPLHVYEFVLWALDVDQLPGTAGLSTVELRTRLLPMHAIAMSQQLIAKGQEGGP